MMENDEKVRYLDVQLIATIGLIISLLLSYLLIYDKKNSLEKKERIFNNDNVQNIALIQTLLVFVLSFIFLYVVYNQYLISKKYKNNDTDDLKLQMVTSVLFIMSAIIGLYIVVKNYDNNLSISEIENI